MHFAELDRDDFRIYAGACEVQGGYTAGVAVRRVRGPGAGELPVIYREDALAGGHRWPTPAEALRYALDRGLTTIRGQITCASYVPTDPGVRDPVTAT